MLGNEHHHPVLMLMPTINPFFSPSYSPSLTLRKSWTIPKSHSLRMPSLVIKTFSGLTFNKRKRILMKFLSPSIFTHIHMNIIQRMKKIQSLLSRKRCQSVKIQWLFLSFYLTYLIEKMPNH